MEAALWILLAVAQPRDPILPLWAMELLASSFMYAWLFCVGACVGSFLNVVIYRLPRGKNLAHPGSFCPRCGHAIRLRDNIPILSWLLLRGRCRDCQNVIPSRYFVVELAVALIFLAVAVVETQLTGNNPRLHRWIVDPHATFPFWSRYLVHVVLLATLLAASLIDHDGFRTPPRLFVPSTIAALALPLAQHALVDQPNWIATPTTTWQAHTIAVCLGWLVGTIAGALVGVLWWWNAADHQWPRFSPIGLMGSLGAVLGWQHLMESSAAGLSVFALAALWSVGSQRTRILPLAGVLMVIIVPRLMHLDERLGVPIVWPLHFQFMIAAVCLVVMLVATIVAVRSVPIGYFAEPPVDPPLVALEEMQTNAIEVQDDLIAQEPPAPLP